MTFETRLLLSRIALLGLLVVVAGVAVVRRKAVGHALREFFTAATSPTNLAVYRIVFFAAVLVDFGNDYDPDTVTFYASLPHALHTAPEPGAVWSRVLTVLPVTPDLAIGAIWLLRAFSFLAMVGLFARVSAWMVVVLGLYVLGVPQYFGKVNHTHHLLWFATILASSRCADALSVDAWIGRWRSRRAGEPVDPPPAPSRQYALPLRFVWILIGLIYFFPGFHKVWTGGIDWALSDNFRNRMWEAWYQRDVFADGLWRPVVRLDRYPLLYKLAAVGAIAFELTWVFLIFSTRRLRLMAAVVALTFHLGTYVLMKIQFWSLVLNFVTFVDWDGLFRGRRAKGTPGIFLHGGSETASTLPGISRVSPLPPLPRAAVASFAVLFVGNVLFGLKGARDGWPFTCYPTFAQVRDATIAQTDVVVTDATGGRIEWDKLGVKNRFSKSRYSALMEQLGKERDARKMRAFWSVLSNQDPKFAEAARVEFYAVTYSTQPGPTHAELSRARVWEAELIPRAGDGG